MIFCDGCPTYAWFAPYARHNDEELSWFTCVSSPTSDLGKGIGHFVWICSANGSDPGQ